MRPGYKGGFQDKIFALYSVLGRVHANNFLNAAGKICSCEILTVQAVGVREKEHFGELFEERRKDRGRRRNWKRATNTHIGY